jgi:hypothetical protein
MMMVGFWGVLVDYRNDARDHIFIGDGSRAKMFRIGPSNDNLEYCIYPYCNLGATNTIYHPQKDVDPTSL